MGGISFWFIQGNPLAKLGVILLFFGLAYLLKYSAEHGMLPVNSVYVSQLLLEVVCYI